MISFAILEDNPNDSALLVQSIKKAFASFKEEIAVSVYDNALDFLERGLASDVVFFDIQLPGMNGMEAAKRFREHNKSAFIIFVTNLGQFALKGYEVNAFDFVVKPLEYENFLLKARRLEEALKGQDKGHRLAIKTSEGTKFAATSEIVYLESVNHDLIFHLENGQDLETRGRLRDYEAGLSPFGFFLCNRCYLINLRFLSAVEDDMAVLGKRRLLIARQRKKGLLAAVNEYLARS